MLRKFLAALAMLFLCGTTAAQATIVGPLPYTLTNGSTADAAQVMANFNKIVNDVNTNVIFPAFSQQNYYAADSGAANAMVVTLSPAPALYVAGMVVNVKVAVANTGATTINANGLGAQNVVNLDGSVLKGSQLLAASIAQLIYDGTQFELNSLTPLALRQATVSRTNTIYTTSGAWTFMVPTGVYSLHIEGWGGGGGGGGTSGGFSAAGGGGGAYGFLYLTVSPGDVISGNVGIGGTGGASGGANTGATGGTTTILKNGASQCSLIGGSGGVGSASNITVAGGAGGNGSGSCPSITGQIGGYSFANVGNGGFGGSAARGAGGGSSAGGQGGNPGGGGGGTTGTGAGGVGGVGWVYIEY